MKNGFTLIELLVVVLIIAILSAVALPQYQTAVERSRATEALTLMNAVRTSLERYHAQHDEFPSGENPFQKLDVDLPVTTNCLGEGETQCFGGKYFQISFAVKNGTATVTATRFTGAYQLDTTVSPNDVGGYTATRSCTSLTEDDEGTDYCNAISGGHSDDF